MATGTEKVTLSHLNSIFVLEGSEKRRSIEILKIIIEEGEPSNLKLIVLDEKDIPIYSQTLATENQNRDREVIIDKKFVFYEHIFVRVDVVSDSSPFAVAVVFK